MDDSAPQERPLQSLQVGSVEEGFVPPNIIRPVMDGTIVRPDEGKGLVPPQLVRLPQRTPAPTPAPAVPPTPAPASPSTPGHNTPQQTPPNK